MKKRTKKASVGKLKRRSVPPKTGIPDVGIFGLGYVGLTTAACLLERQSQVEGYDVSEAKRALLAKGVCPVSEPGVKPAIERGLKSGAFRISEGLTEGRLPKILFICVGTPSRDDGSCDVSHVLAVFEYLAQLARKDRNFKVEIFLRSTVPPGTLAHLRTLHPDLFAKVPVAFYPEFLREGTAMKDFYEPVQSIVGVLRDGIKPTKLPGILTKLGVVGATTIVDAISAESVKFACNAYHALKVCFANEVARMVSISGGDAKEVMDLFCRDTKLNVSRKYLSPGNPYGGSCLPKDVKSMVHYGRQIGATLDLVDTCQASNKNHFDYIVKTIKSSDPQVIALLGLSFKKSTDDVRNSPSVELINRLTSDGIGLIQVHDYLVNVDAAVDLNKRLQNQLFAKPTLVLHRNLSKTLKGADLVVIMHSDERYRAAVKGLRVRVLDVASWTGFGP